MRKIFYTNLQISEEILTLLVPVSELRACWLAFFCPLFMVRYDACLQKNLQFSLDSLLRFVLFAHARSFIYPSPRDSLEKKISFSLKNA
jgi:hypothetical protein